MATYYERAPVQPAKQVSEGARERETFKYYSSLVDNARVNETGQPIPASELSAADDVILTGLAQLGLHQTDTDRALISLFDADHQYIVAEATKTQRLHPSLKSDDCSRPLWLCGTAIPRTHGVCELSLLADTKLGNAAPQVSTELALTIAQDLVLDPRFSAKPFCQPGTLARFYAAVPIRTRRGINIGVYCVINETPGKRWTEAQTERIRDISRAIMDHLESQRMKELQRRSERMNRGLGSFIEGKSTISGWQLSYSPAAYLDNPSHEGALNSREQLLQRRQGELANDMAPTVTLPTAGSNGRPDHGTKAYARGAFYQRNRLQLYAGGPEANSSALEDLGTVPRAETSAGVLSKAANIIRESIEVEGCCFFDTTMHAYRTVSKTNTGADPASQSSATSSSDENLGSKSEDQVWPLCRLLGYSTSVTSSLDGDASKHVDISLAETFLARLLRRYPKGKIFNFGADGELQSESPEDDRTLSLSDDIGKHPPLKNGTAGIAPVSSRDKPPRNPWSRHNEGRILLKAFPRARSVAFVPVWDPRKDRWYAGGFIYTNDPTRVFTVEGELSYLRAFGILSMSEILSFNDLQADKAKSDALGSLSHELRSPLYGILLSAELLIDTKLNVFQRNMAHTIETCSRTLVDTIDNLLDYSKINNLAGRDDKLDAIRAFRATSAGADPRQFGKKNLYCNSQLDNLVEEVVESVFAGFNFQHLSAKQLSVGQSGLITNSNKADGRLDSMRAREHLDPVSTTDGELQVQYGEVLIILSIDTQRNWTYYIEVGAIRRIFMNIIGNALKYTYRGTIRVSLTQEIASIKRRKKEPVVKFTVEDTGKGIGADFLQHGLFRPFSQEDSLLPGTGLGLSLVKQLTSQLRGEISIRSEVGVGTKVSVALPLEQLPQSLESTPHSSDEDKAFEGQVGDLRGLRVLLHMSNPDWRRSVAAICGESLHMEVISDKPDATVTPDLIMWSHTELPGLSESLGTFAKTPNVVVCADALAAYRQSKLFNSVGSPAVFEFISQPTGPRKLARTLLLAYTRWMGHSEALSPASSAPMVVNRPEGPHRAQSSLIVADAAAPPSVRQMPSSATPRNGTALWADEKDCSAVSDSEHGTLSSSSTSDESLPSPSGSHVSPTKFLLVDDNHINLKVLSAYMKKLRLEYDTAMNGKEAVDFFVLHPRAYVCVLMDISMPVMDGFEATRRIRAHENQAGLTHVPIIALSGLASEEAQQEAFGCGMDLFLTKPVKLRALGSLLASRGIILKC